MTKVISFGILIGRLVEVVVSNYSSLPDVGPIYANDIWTFVGMNKLVHAEIHSDMMRMTRHPYVHCNSLCGGAWRPELHLLLHEVRDSHECFWSLIVGNRDPSATIHFHYDAPAIVFVWASTAVYVRLSD